MTRSAFASRVEVGDVGRSMGRSAIGNLAVPAVVFITAPILARSLGVTGRGDLAAATAPLLLMTTLATVGVPEAVTYLVARNPQLLRAAIRSGSALLTLAGIAATGLAWLASDLLSDHNASVRRLIMVTSLTIVPVVVLGALRGAASALQLWGLVNREKYLTATTRLAGILGLLSIHSLTVASAAIVIASSTLIAGAVYLPIANSAWRGHEPDQPTVRRPVISYAARVWIGSLSGVLLTRLDQSIMAPLAGAAQLGLYAAAVNVSDAALLINNAIRDVTFAADAADQSTERLARTSRVSFLASILAGVALAGSLPVWFPLLFGEAFKPAEPVAVLLIAAAVLGVPGSIAGAGLSSRGRPGLRSACLVAACVINVALLFALVPPWGATGAGVAMLVGTLVAAFLAVAAASRLCDVSPLEFMVIRGSDARVLVRTMRRLLRRPPSQSHHSARASRQPGRHRR